jgi:hypothetical protein
MKKMKNQINEENDDVKMKPRTKWYTKHMKIRMNNKCCK